MASSRPRIGSRLAVASSLALALLACKDATTLSGAKPTPAVAVRPAAASIAPAASLGFQAVVTGVVDTGVTWTVMEVGGGTIDPTGLYTAPPSTGTYHVVAASRADPGVQGTATVSVVPAPVHRLSGSVSPAASGAGASLTLTPPGTTTTADGTGAYAFTGLADGSYTVTPWKDGFSFTPASKTVTVAGADLGGVDFTAAAFTANLTVDGSRTYQVVDGMGTNINVGSWRSGELAPALDLLVDVGGASLLRVIRDPMDWVANEADIPGLHALDPATLDRIYGTPAMNDIWSTVQYLNGKGLRGSQVLLNFMGWTPVWMGGSGGFNQTSVIDPSKNPAFATMDASLVYYGRVKKGLDFGLLGPLNEPDLSGLEGPQVGPSQLATLFGLIANELDAMGQTSVRLVGPDALTGVSGYVDSIRANSTASGRTDHYSFHWYSGTTSPGTSYPGKNYWLTETAVWCSTCDQNGTPSGGEWKFASDNGELLIQDLLNGLPAVLVWEGYDSYWYHHNSYSSWGLLGYDRQTGKYTARKRFYVNAQITRFVRPGMSRVQLTTSVSGAFAAAFVDAASGKVAIVGHNRGTTAATIRGRLSSVAPVTTLSLYQTDSGAKSMTREPDVPVAGNAFTVTIPPDTFFSLAN